MHATKVIALNEKRTPTLLNCMLNEVWHKLTGEVRPHHSSDTRYNLTQNEIEQCLRDFGELFSPVTNSAGNKILKFRPEITRDTIDTIIGATENNDRRTHPLLKAWKVFFMTAEPYYITTPLIEDWQRQGLHAVPSIIVEAIRYNPGRMAGRCWFIEEPFSILSRFGGQPLQRFLKSIQNHKVVYGSDDEYSNLAIVRLLVSMARNGVAIEKDSLLEQRVGMMLKRNVVFKFYHPVTQEILTPTHLNNLVLSLDDPGKAGKLLQDIDTLLTQGYSLAVGFKSMFDL